MVCNASYRDVSTWSNNAIYLGVSIWSRNVTVSDVTKGSDRKILSYRVHLLYDKDCQKGHESDFDPLNTAPQHHVTAILSLPPTVDRDSCRPLRRAPRPPVSAPHARTWPPQSSAHAPNPKPPSTPNTLPGIRGHEVALALARHATQRPATAVGPRTHTILARFGRPPPRLRVLTASLSLSLLLSPSRFPAPHRHNQSKAQSEQESSHGGRVEKARAHAHPALPLLLRGHIGGAAVAHRRQLRRGGGQPAAAGRDGEAAQVHRHHQGAPLRRRRGRHPRAGRHRRLPRGRRGQRRHPRHRRRPQRGLRLARGQRAALRPGLGHLRRGRRQRGARVRGRRARRRAAPGHAEPPRRRRRGRRRGRGGQVLHGQHHGRARAVRPAVHRRVPRGGGRAAAADPGLPQPHRRALHGQPLPLLRVPVRPAAGHARLLPLPAQRRPRGRRVQDQVHQHVRRAGGRRQVGAGPRRVRRRGDRGGGDRVADQGRPHGGRRHRGERQGVRVQPGRAPQVRRRHAADAGEARGHVPLRALRRGPQARAGVGAGLRAVSHRPQHGIRRRADGLVRRDDDDAPEQGVVRGERGRDGGAAADGPGLRVLAGGRRLQRHPARGRVLRAQHGARPRRLRHEPALPGRRQPPLELRLPAVRHPHLHQPQLRLVCLHRRPMMRRRAKSLRP